MRALKPVAFIFILTIGLLLGLFNNCGKSQLNSKVKKTEQSSTSTNTGNEVSLPIVVSPTVEITQQPIGGTYNTGDTVTLVAEVSDSSAAELEFAWYFNGELVAGANSNILVIPGIQPGQAGQYMFLVSSNGHDAESEPAIVVVNQRFANCKAILDSNPAATSGVYEVDPDGYGSGVNAVTTYCDMQSDGGGWTLLFYSHDNSNVALPIVESLALTTRGRFNDATTLAFLNSSNETSKNNVKVIVDASDGLKLTVSMLILEATAPGYFLVPWTANGNCSGYDAGPDPASFTAGSGPGKWGFNNGSSGGHTGYLDESSSRFGELSLFMQNADTGSDATCNQTVSWGRWQPHQKGSLWVR